MQRLKGDGSEKNCHERIITLLRFDYNDEVIGDRRNSRRLSESSVGWIYRWYLELMVSFKMKFIAVSGRKLLLNGYLVVIFRSGASWIYNVLVGSMARNILLD